MNLTRQEQETIIRGSAADQTWEVVTADPRIIRKMEKQGYKPDPRNNPAEYVSFTVPFGRIKILRAEKRKLTPEQVEELRQRLHAPKSPQEIGAKTDQKEPALTQPLP
jgi:hypothetical protein